MAATGINGSAILLKIEISGTPKIVQGQVSGTHDGTVDTAETTHKLSANGAKTYIPTEHSFTISAECKVDPSDATNATYSQVYAAFKAKQIIDYSYGSTVAGQKYYSGECIITGLSESAPQSDCETFSITLQVTGDETESTVTT